MRTFRLLATIVAVSAAGATASASAVAPSELPGGARPALANGALLVTDPATGASYTIYPDGSRKKRVAGPGWERGQFSPDGKLIAWSAMVNKNRDIYITTATGTNARRVTTNAAPDYSPTWSPDGKKIAFQSCRAAESCDIYVLNSTVPYGAAKKLTRSGRGIDPACDEVSWGGPKWSPQGNVLAVFRLCRYDYEPDDAVLHIINASTGAPATGGGSLSASFDWTTDGIALVATNDYEYWGYPNLEYCPLAPGEYCHELTPYNPYEEEYEAHGPVVAPNNQLVAYQAKGAVNTWFIRMDGTRARKFLDGLYPTDWRAW